jgi:hypothetical protein
MNFQQLSQFDLDRCVAAIPPELQELLKKHGSSLVVAGGFIRAIVAGEKPADIDVWTDSKQRSQDASEQLAGNVLVHTSPRAYTVRRETAIPVQFIHQWTFANPESLLSSFDFTIAQAALWWDGEKWATLASTLFYADVEARRLTYLAPIRTEAVAGSLFRVFKFYKRGYSISLEDFAAVMARATGLPVSDLLTTLQQAGARLPAAPKRCEETPDDIGAPIGALCGAGSG